MAGDRHLDRLRLGVPDAVGQRLLHGAIDAGAMPIRQRRRIAVDARARRRRRSGAVKSRTCHSSAACRPKSSSMLGRRPSARSRTVRNMLSTSFLALGDRRADPLVAGRPDPLDAAELHAQRGQHLRDVIVQLARQVLPLLFLRRDQLLRQLPHLPLGLLGERTAARRTARSSDAQPEDGAERDGQAEQHAPPEQPVRDRRGTRRAAARLRPAGPRGWRCSALRSPGRWPAPASRRGTTSRRRKLALRRIFSVGVQSNSGSNVCQYSSSCVCRLEIRSSSSLWRTRRSSATVAMLVRRNSASRCRYSGRALALDVEQVVADENAGEIDVGAQPPELDVDVVVVGVELVELGVDLLRLARRREHRHHDQQQQAAEPERRHRPGLEPHQDLRTRQCAVIRKVTSPCRQAASGKQGRARQRKSSPGSTVRIGLLPRKRPLHPVSDRMVLAGASLFTRPVQSPPAEVEMPGPRPNAARRIWTAERLQRSLEHAVRRRIDRRARQSRAVQPRARAQTATSSCERSAGGLVTALEPLIQRLLRRLGGARRRTADRAVVDWRDGLEVPPGSPAYRLRRVWLNDDEQRGYYFGFRQRRPVAACATGPTCSRSSGPATSRSTRR